MHNCGKLFSNSQKKNDCDQAEENICNRNDYSRIKVLLIEYPPRCTGNVL